MIPSTILTFCLVLITSSALAQPVKSAPRMSGRALVDQYLGSPAEAGDMSARTFAYHQLAKGYLDGINDATEGTVWCYSGRWKSDERDHALIVELAKLPPEVLRGNAAPLVLNFLRKKYPCPAGSTKKGE